MFDTKTNHLNTNKIAKLLLELERRADALVEFISSPQLREASKSLEWRTNRALCDLDCVLNSAVEDFLLCGELSEALLSLEGEAACQEYRVWLARYRQAEKELDAAYPGH